MRQESCLVLNRSKTKDLVIDFRGQEKNPEALISKEKEVVRMETFKYLGVVLNNKLTWKNSTDVIVSTTKTRRYCL